MSYEDALCLTAQVTNIHRFFIRMLGDIYENEHRSVADDIAAAAAASSSDPRTTPVCQKMKQSSPSGELSRKRKAAKDQARKKLKYQRLLSDCDDDEEVGIGKCHCHKGQCEKEVEWEEVEFDEEEREKLPQAPKKIDFKLATDAQRTAYVRDTVKYIDAVIKSSKAQKEKNVAEIKKLLAKKKAEKEKETIPDSPDSPDPAPPNSPNSPSFEQSQSVI